MRGIDARLSKLERRRTGQTKYVFANAGETTDEAISRVYPDGEPPNVVVLRWMEE